MESSEMEVDTSQPQLPEKENASTATSSNAAHSTSPPVAQNANTSTNTTTSNFGDNQFRSPPQHKRVSSASAVSSPVSTTTRERNRDIPLEAQIVDLTIEPDSPPFVPAVLRSPLTPPPPLTPPIKSDPSSPVVDATSTPSAAVAPPPAPAPPRPTPPAVSEFTSLDTTLTAPTTTINAGPTLTTISLSPRASPPLPTPTSTDAPINILGPKRKPKRPAPPVPQAPAPYAPPPVLTVRLAIPLLAPGRDYQVNVLDLARAAGQRAPTPPPIVHSDASSDEGSSDDEAVKTAAAIEARDGAAGLVVKRRRRKDKKEYDLDDPFIDDSELLVDEPKFMARTKQDGFYVSSGKVALFDPSKKKGPRPKVSFTSGRSPSLVQHQSSTPPRPVISSTFGPPPHITTPSRDPTTHFPQPPSTAYLPNSSPAGPELSMSMRDLSMITDGEDGMIASLGEAQQQQQQKSRKRSLDSSQLVDSKSGIIALAGGNVVAAPGSDGGGDTDGHKKKKQKTLVAVEPFTQEMEAMLDELRAAVAKESFEQKAKFPQVLRPVLERVCVRALYLGEYGDNLFNVMPKIFPYNRYTMMKLIKKTVFNEHQKMLSDKSDALLAQLREHVEVHRARHEAEYDSALRAYEEHQSAKRAAGSGSEAAAEPTPSVAPDTPDPDAAAPKEKEDKPPTKKFRWTEPMKNILWELVALSNESAALSNEKSTLDGCASIVSEQSLRKDLYKKIVNCFPDGWMMSTAISREVSQMKKKFSKDQLQDQEMDD